MKSKAHPIEKLSFDQIQEKWLEIQRLDIRSQIKEYRTLGHYIYNNYDKETSTAQQLEIYIRIIKHVIAVHSSPQRFSILLSKMINDWLSLTGNADVEIILKKSGKVSTNTATITIADPKHIERKEISSDVSDNNFIGMINKGKLLIFETGSDGAYNIQVRVINAAEPVLTTKEYKRVTDYCETAIIDIPNGIVAVADFAALGDEAENLTVKVTPGYYKVAVFLFQISNKFESYYIVLCKTNSKPVNNYSKVFYLGS